MVLDYWAKITEASWFYNSPHNGQAKLIFRNLKAKIQIKLKKRIYDNYVSFEEIKVEPFQFDLYSHGVIDWVELVLGDISNPLWWYSAKEFFEATITEVRNKGR